MSAVSLADKIETARQLALDPEQPLLRMLAQRKASRRVLEAAARSYRRAADLMEEALASIPEKSGETSE